MFVGLVVLINLVAHQLDYRLDLTKSKQHTLSPETKELLSQIDQPITLTALHVGMAPKYLEDMLKGYERASQGNVTTKIIDPLVDIGYASQFGNIITGKQKKIEKEKRRTAWNIANLVSPDFKSLP